MAALTNLPSKLSRAICAYLVSIGIDQRQVFPQQSSRERSFELGPIVSPLILSGLPAPALTGDKRFKVAIQIKGSEANDGSEGAGEAKRVEFDAFVGKVNEALMQCDDEVTLRATATAINTAGRDMATVDAPEDEALKLDWCKAVNNADMQDFTLVHWVDATVGSGEAKDCTWEIVIMFDGTACESNVD